MRYEEGTELTEDEITAKVLAHRPEEVEITGGERCSRQVSFP